MIIFTHIIISIALFYLINIIGQFAPIDTKYYQITGFLETDEAPAFNFTFRILTPVVFIILLSSLLYQFEQDYYVKDIYWVSIYYVSFRAIFNILTNRTYLINWKKQIFYALCTVGTTYFVYERLIIKKENLLPDFSNIANELWIIILIFIYNLINNIKISESGAENRKLKYIKNALNNIKHRYSNIITSKVSDIRLHQIIYAIIIHESFNRPKIFRILEYIKSKFSSKKVSFGIMQVKSEYAITDSESIEKGIDIIIKHFETLKVNFKIEYENEEANEYSLEYLEQDYQAKLIREYNHCDDYTYEIKDLADYINEKFYLAKKDTRNLFLNYIS